MLMFDWWLSISGSGSLNMKAYKTEAFNYMFTYIYKWLSVLVVEHLEEQKPCQWYDPDVFNWSEEENDTNWQKKNCSGQTLSTNYSLNSYKTLL